MTTRGLARPGVFDDFLGPLSDLADDLDSARSDPTLGYEDAAREVLTFSSAVAQELADWATWLDLPYGELDAVLRAVASRDPAASDCAELGSQLFAFLRQISYGIGPNPADAPDVADFSALFEQLIDHLSRVKPDDELEPVEDDS